MRAPAVHQQHRARAAAPTQHADVAAGHRQLADLRLRQHGLVDPVGEAMRGEQIQRQRGLGGQTRTDGLQRAKDAAQHGAACRCQMRQRAGERQGVCPVSRAMAR